MNLNYKALAFGALTGATAIFGCWLVVTKIKGVDDVEFGVDLDMLTKQGGKEKLLTYAKDNENFEFIIEKGTCTREELIKYLESEDGSGVDFTSCEFKLRQKKK